MFEEDVLLFYVLVYFGRTAQKNVLFIVATVRTSNPAEVMSLY
jgi:hypothetical protein